MASAADRRLIASDVAAKVVLAALLLFSVTHTDWARFADKAMTARAVAYPVLVAIVPVAWWLVRRRRPVAYPADVALLITIPFVVDVAGNALDLYDSVDWFDDACHLVNWAILCAAVGLGLVRIPSLAPWIIAGLCVGFGATTAILWEVGEYGAFILKTPERLSLYRDTIGDLSLGLAGSVLAGVGCAALAHRRHVAMSAPARTPGE